MESNEAKLKVRQAWFLAHGGQQRRFFFWVGLFILLLLFLTDDVTHRWALSLHNRWLDQLFHLTKIFGRAAFAFALGAIFYVIGKLRHNGRWQRAGGLIVGSVLVAGLLVLIAKPIFGRRELLKVSSAQLRPAPQSRRADVDKRWGRFPSGDSAVAFATAGALAVEFPAASAGLLILASLTAIGRVYGNIHLASDVFAGGCLGWLVAQWLGHRQWPGRRKRRNQTASSGNSKFS